METGAEVGKHILDGVSVGVLVAALADALPILATALTVIWTGLRIYETATVQRWARRRRIRARLRRQQN